MEAWQGKLVQLGGRLLVVAFIGSLLASTASLVHAQDGTASGRLTVNAVTVSVTHAYASAQPGFFDKKTEDVRVLLSDVPLPETALTDVFELIELARRDAVHVVEVLIDANGAPISGAIYTKAFDGMVSATGMHKFTRERLERSRIAGRLAVPEPHTFNGVTWQYDATFSAPIPGPPSPEEAAAALASAPARAAAAYLEAVRSGKLPALLATLAPSAAANYRGADAQDRLKQLRADMPADARVASVTKKPDGSVLVSLEGHEKGIVIAYTLKMVQDGGAWKVGK
jgi:hypothetical protein